MGRHRRRGVCSKDWTEKWGANVDGWAHDRFSSSGMLFTEAALGVAGAAVFLVLFAVLRGNRRGKGDAALLPAEG